MSALSVALLTGLVLAQPRVEYSATGRSDVRVRQTRTDATETAEADVRNENEVSLTPRLGLTATLLTLEGSLEYAPLVLVRNPVTQVGTEVMHNGVAELRWRLDRRTRLELRQEIGSGERRLTLLDGTAAGGEVPLGGGGLGGGLGPGGPGGAGGSGGPLTPGGETGGALPPLEPLRLFHSYTRATFAHSFDRRVDGFARAGYLVTGGADDPTRETLPLLLGPILGLGADVRLTKRDRLASEAQAQSADFAPQGQRTQLVQLSAGYTRTLTRELGVSAGLGAAAGRNTVRPGTAGGAPGTGSGAEASDAWRPFPIARGGLDYILPLGGRQRLTARGALSYAPVMNPFNTELEQQGALGGSLEWQPQPRYSVGASTLLSTYARPAPAPVRQNLAVGLVGGWRPETWCQLDASAGFSVEREGEGALRRSWLAQLSFTASADGPL